MLNSYNPNQFVPYDDGYNEDDFYDHEELEWESDRNEYLAED